MFIAVSCRCVVTPYSVVVGSERFRGPCFFHFTQKTEKRGPPKRRYPTTTLHGVTTQKTST